MNTVTQCPACGTLFRVVEDQLRISQGWVRCGLCQTVFDAQESLRPEGAADRVAPEHQPEQFTNLQADSSLPQDASDQAWQADVTQAKLDANAATTASLGVGTGSANASITAQPEARIEPSLQPLPLDAAQTPALAHDEATAQPIDPNTRSIGFLNGSSNPTAIQPSSGLWIVLAVLLTLAMAAQALWWGRHQLAARAPAVSPMLSQACTWLGCSIDAIEQLDALSVEGVSILPAAGNSYRLNLTLRNKAAHAVATPSIELSLQDTQDNVTVKRVLSPTDLALPQPSLPPQAEVSAQAHIQLRDSSPSKRVSGYRVVAFYP
jgi:predicted Zn finger-like uncharacterized protein